MGIARLDRDSGDMPICAYCGRGDGQPMTRGLLGRRCNEEAQCLDRLTARARRWAREDVN